MASIVGTYARAFADVVMRTELKSTPEGAKGGTHLDPDRTLRELDEIRILLHRNIQLRRILENPSIPGEQKRSVLDAIAAKMGITRQVKNFIAVITDHRRLPLLGEIAKQFEAELNDRRGFADAQVTSARELSDQEEKLIETQILSLTGKEQVKAKYDVDPALLGGAVVQVGSTIYDGSVKGQLEKIRQRLEDGSF